MPDPKKMMPHKTADTTPEHVGMPADAQAPAPSAAPPAALTAAPGLGTMVHAFRRCCWYALPLGLVAGLLGAAGALFFYPGAYNSTVVFRLLPRPTHGQQEDEGHFVNVQRSHVSMMKSHEVLAEAIEKSHVAEKYDVVYTPQSLAKKLTASFNEGAEIMTVTLTGEHPEAMAAVLKSLGEVYPRHAVKADRERLEGRIASLRRSIDGGPDRDDPSKMSLQDKLTAKRFDIDKELKDREGGDPNRLKLSLDGAIEAQRNARGKKELAEKTLIDLKVEIETLENNPPRLSVRKVTESEVMAAVSGNAKYVEAEKYVRELEVEIAKNRKAGRTESLRRARADLEDQLDEWIRYRDGIEEQIRRNLQAKNRVEAQEEHRKAEAAHRKELDKAKTHERELKRQLETYNADLAHYGKQVEQAHFGGQQLGVRLKTLRDQEAWLKGEIDALEGEVARLQGLLASEARVRLHSESFVPQERDTSKSYKIAIGMGVLCMLCVVGALCFMETRGRRVYSSDDVNQGLGMRVIGTLPKLPAAARSKTASAQALGGLDARYGMNEAVDAIRTVLMHAPRNDGARVILVSSAIGGEGKTTLASHLAASLSRAWRKTLLIDGDLRKPALHGQFDLPLEPGFSEALRGEIEFDDAIKPTMTSRLWLMPAGKVDGHSLQALAQEALGNVLETLKEQYDFIVIDTSPVLLVPDGLMLARLADVVLMSVMRDHSRIPAVYAAQQKLAGLGISVLGGVVIGEKTEAYGHAVPYPQS